MDSSNDHSDWEQQLRTLRASLQLDPEQVDITKLAPVFIPSKFLLQGNWIGPPEMSCGIALSRELETGELEKFTTMIGHCYREGTRPLAPGIFAPADLQAA